jgi:hypothetical protein
MDLIFGGWAFIGRFLVWNCFVVKDLDLTFKTYIISYFSNSKCTLVFTKEVPLPKEFHIKRFFLELRSSFLSILFPWIWYTAIYKCNAITVLSVPILESRTWTVICTETHHAPGVACTFGSLCHYVSAWYRGSAATYPTACTRNKRRANKTSQRPSKPLELCLLRLVSSFAG